ncbi:MAG: hypothetical protein IIB26_07200 [Chloroflexi bacterium]|nr:hypothetical protein [Chloroflexota bacterium]
MHPSFSRYGDIPDFPKYQGFQGFQSIRVFDGRKAGIARARSKEPRKTRVSVDGDDWLINGDLTCKAREFRGRGIE